MHALSDDKNCLQKIKNSGEVFETDIPADIHTPLLKYGKISKPDIAENYKESLWIENKSWWFKKEFSVNGEMLENQKIMLVFERLDCMADIFVNDTHIGTHKSVFFPFAADIKEYINIGKNEIYVRLTTGLEYFSKLDAENLPVCDFYTPTRSDFRRTLLRKPQYVFGWDWCPRIPTCGITGDVYLEFINDIEIKNIHIRTLSISESAKISIEVETENINISKSINAKISILIKYKEETVSELQKNVFVRSGINYTDFNAEIEDPQLWWPNGYGEQPLYTAEISVCYSGETKTASESFGIRTVEISCAEQGENENEFVFVVNGKKIFAKGGNWVPAECIYNDVTEEKLTALIKSAKNLSFNMLRVWGGGVYESDAFYRLCDEYGILIWHDFMFACSMVPDRSAEFLDLVRSELTYQIKRLRNHPSLALWCGSNENHQFYEIWAKDLSYFGGEIIYNRLAPECVRQLSPEIPYWNSSPYGGDFVKSNAAGDEHCWENHFLGDDKARALSLLQYDLDTAKFVSEYGHLGPCCKKTTVEYLGSDEIDLKSSAFITHINTMNSVNMGNSGLVEKGMEKYYNVSTPTPEEYLLYGGAVQGMFYEYSIDAHRIMPYCGGNLIWMFNDCWGEVGWTPIDYRLRKKIAYYFIKRAYKAQRMVLRKENDEVFLYIVCDKAAKQKKQITVGYTDFCGNNRREITVTANVSAGITKINTGFCVSQNELLCGAVYAIDSTGEAEKALLYCDNYKKSDIPAAKAQITNVNHENGKTAVTVKATGYVHCVFIKDIEEYEASDLFFDMLPEEVKTITLNTPPNITLQLDYINKYCS